MSDNTWRMKKYYAPRVLLETEDVLTPLFPDALLCLSGSELYLLRNLCQYLHRRSTFVSEYGVGYYLAPTNEEWDALEAITAGLEEKLMGCEDYLALLQCICDGVKDLQGGLWPAGGVLQDQRDYDDYQSTVEFEVGDPPEGFATWSDWTQYKCKAAQKIVDDLTDLGEKLEVWYSAGAAITFAVFQTFVIGTAVAPPVALALAVIGILATAGTALAMIAFQNWLQEHKKNLVCGIHLSDTVQGARASILGYIDENWDLALASQFAEHLFSWDVLSKAYDGGLDVSAYSASYCDPCLYLEGDGWFATPLDPAVYTCFLSWGAVNGLTIPKLDGYVVLGVLWDCYENNSGVDVLDGREWAISTQNLFEYNHDTHGLPGDWQLSIYPTEGVDESEVVAALHPGAYLVTTLTDYVAAAQPQCGFGWKWNGGSPWTVTCRAHYLVYQGEPPA